MRAHIEAMVVSRTHCNIDVVHAKRSKEQIYAEKRSDNQRDWKYKWCQEIKQRLVELLEDEEFGTNLPEPKLPGEEDVGHVVEHAVDEEEVPSVKALTEDGHLAEAATAAAREKDGGRRFCFYEDGGAHGDATSKFSGRVAKEPIFRDRESRRMISTCAGEDMVSAGLTQGECGKYLSETSCPRLI